MFLDKPGVMFIIGPCLLTSGMIERDGWGRISARYFKTLDSEIACCYQNLCSEQLIAIRPPPLNQLILQVMPNHLLPIRDLSTVLGGDFAHVLLAVMSVSLDIVF